MSREGPRDLAVVIVNYNTGEYLGRCLDSLEAHRGSIDLDVLVIDNASSDQSARSAEGREGVRLIANDENVFLSPAWNQGARLTSSRFVLFLNPDTEWWRGTLEDLVRIAEDHVEAGIVGPMVRNMDGSVYPSGRAFPRLGDAVGHAFLGAIWPGNPFTRRYYLDGWDRRSERVVDWVSGCCMLMRRSAFDSVGGFDESFLLYGEELDIATRMASEGWSVLYTPEVELLHELGVSTGRTRATVRMHSDSIYGYYRKHRAQGWRRLTLPIARIVLAVRAELEWIRIRAVQ
jgi:N-acetylglucosaminyl-diphospho-decaprenol L-rhamnosyltransferase